jgi:hypothetical protein
MSMLYLFHLFLASLYRGDVQQSLVTQGSG